MFSIPHLDIITSLSYMMDPLEKVMKEFFSMHYGMSYVNVYWGIELVNIVLLVREKGPLYAQLLTIQSGRSIVVVYLKGTQQHTALGMKSIPCHNEMPIVKCMNKNGKQRG